MHVYILLCVRAQDVSYALQPYCMYTCVYKISVHITVHMCVVNKCRCKYAYTCMFVFKMSCVRCGTTCINMWTHACIYVYLCTCACLLKISFMICSSHVYKCFYAHTCIHVMNTITYAKVMNGRCLSFIDQHCRMHVCVSHSLISTAECMYASLIH